jgi:hypothetical protein
VMIQATLFDVDSVKPRETVTVKVATTDVSAAYEKLRGTVAQVKGRVLTGQINEQDRRNITAFFFPECFGLATFVLLCS